MREIDKIKNKKIMCIDNIEKFNEYVELIQIDWHDPIQKAKWNNNFKFFSDSLHAYIFSINWDMSKISEGVITPKSTISWNNYDFEDINLNRIDWYTFAIVYFESLYSIFRDLTISTSNKNLGEIDYRFSNGGYNYNIPFIRYSTLDEVYYDMISVHLYLLKGYSFSRFMIFESFISLCVYLYHTYESKILLRQNENVFFDTFIDNLFYLLKRVPWQEEHDIKEWYFLADIIEVGFFYD